VIAATINWSGSYELPRSASPVAIVLTTHGKSAIVALGPGHAQSQPVSIVLQGRHIRFRLPGVPHDVSFDGTVKTTTISGEVTQGAIHGSFTLHQSLDRITRALGVYRSATGEGIAVLAADGLSPFLIEFPSGATHGVGPALSVGQRLGSTDGNGALSLTSRGLTWKGMQFTRVRLRQEEVRIGVDAATLTTPPGLGPFPGVVMVHGSGPRTRDEFDVFTAYFALHGIAVLADDKRGVGQSGGNYPGDAASTTAIDLLASDAQAEVRFLAARPHLDPARIGLFGDSQAGWIVPLAASREPRVHFAVLNSGPTVTVGESDLWGSLAGESQAPPSGTRADMLDQVQKAGPSGFDPLPYIKKLTIPVLWMYGSDDRNVPTELCLDRINSLQTGHDFTTIVLPTTHTPLVLPTGLLSSLPRSPGFDPNFFPDLDEWLARHRIGTS